MAGSTMAEVNKIQVGDHCWVVTSHIVTICWDPCSGLELFVDDGPCDRVTVAPNYELSVAAALGIVKPDDVAAKNTSESCGPPTTSPSDLDVSSGPAVHPIQVWRFDDAPKEYSSLSPHGGDEDWLAFVPDEYGEWCPEWLEDNGTRFARCDISKHEVEGGTVFIGAHA